MNTPFDDIVVGAGPDRSLIITKPGVLRVAYQAERLGGHRTIATTSSLIRATHRLPAMSGSS